MDQTSIGTLTPPVKAACDFNARLRIRRDVYSRERRGGNSVGRVPASQAGCRGFESRPPLPERDGIMPKGGALHIGAPRLISPLGPVWVQTIEKPLLIWALGRLSSEQDRSQH